MDKLITFSFDDGTVQDRRLIELLNKYGLKATFNLNSALLGQSGRILLCGREVCYDKIAAGEVAVLYEGHEVASHSLTHPDLKQLCEEDVGYQVEADRLKLSELCGYEVSGFAYPGGGVNYNRAVTTAIKSRTNIKYARTIDDTLSFSMPDDPYVWNPTRDVTCGDLFFIAEKFFASDGGGLMYVWGHSFGLDAADMWDKFEGFCEFISRRKGTRYLTNREVLDYKEETR